MTNVRISELPTASTLTGSELVPVVQGGTTKKSTVGAVVGYSSFIQEGIGAVYRTMQDKAREWISVKDYGAVGDGVTNDRANIQKAFDAAAVISSSRGSCCVHFPPGTYVVINGMTVTSDNVTINGYGASLEFSASAAPIPPAAATTPCILIRGNNCGIFGLHIYCPGTQTRLSAGIGIQAGYGVLETPNTTTKGLIIQDCILDNIGCAGIWVNNVENAIVSNCVVQYCKADGIHFSDGCFGAVASGNVVAYCEDDSISILNDYKTDVPDLLCGKFAITGNTIIGAVGLWGAGITIGCAQTGVISGNNIQDTVGPGIAMYNTGGETVATQWANNVIVTGNNFSNCGVTTTATPGYIPGTNNGHPGTSFIGMGILLDAAYKITISGNTFCNMQYDATYSQGVIRCNSVSDIQIVNNTFYDNAATNIYLNYPNVNPYTTIANNTFGQCSRYNIYILSPGTGTPHDCKHAIRYNTFYQTASLGDLYIDSILSFLDLEYSGVSTNNFIRVSNNPTKSRFLAYATANQAVTSGSYQLLTTPAPIYDANYVQYYHIGDFDTTTSTFTAPSTGYYVFTGGVYYTFATVGDGGIAVFISGSTSYFVTLSYRVNGGTNTSWTTSGQQNGSTPPLLLVKGDTAVLKTYTSINQTTSPGRSYTYFGGYQL